MSWQILTHVVTLVKNERSSLFCLSINDEEKKSLMALSPGPLNVEPQANDLE
jgi:hypothetical protein